MRSPESTPQSLLEVIVQGDLDREYMPISAAMIDSLREIIADGVDGGYDIDAVLAYLALAVKKLENTMEQRHIELLDLDLRIRKAGLRLPPPTE